MKLLLLPIIVLLAMIPVGLICWYISNKAHNSEPFYMLFLLFLLGVISCIPAIFAEEFFALIVGQEPNTNSSLLGIFIYYFFGVAFIEEVVKWIACYLVGFNNKAFDKAYDMIIYAVFTSLGFAFLEDVLYLLASENFLATAILRAVISIPGHACFAIIMGYFLSLVRYYANIKDRAREVLYTLLSILVPTTIHAIFDSLLTKENMIYTMIFFIFVISVNLLCFTNAHRLYKKNIDV
jgi:RsiW-degrading membrane proteinase PrsW (M82 family)